MPSPAPDAQLTPSHTTTHPSSILTPTMPPFDSSAREIGIAHVDIEAVDLRAAGWTYPEIAAHQKCHLTTAKERVKRSLIRWYTHDTEETRTLEMERLDRATLRLITIMEQRTGQQRKTLTDPDGAIRKDGDGRPLEVIVVDPETGKPVPVATRADDDRAIRAIEKLVMVSARRAALLGLDQPKRVQAEMHVDMDGNIRHEHEVTITVLDAFQEYADVLGEIVAEEATPEFVDDAEVIEDTVEGV